MLSVIVPVYNEEGAIAATVRGVHAALSTLKTPWEIVVVDDGSTDATPALLRDLSSTPELRVITHSVNRGNGAAIKTGIRSAQGDMLATVDADGTYPLGDFPRLFREMQGQGADMIVGVRPTKGSHAPWSHRAAKALLVLLSRPITGIRIPDINSGMRIFRRSLVERFWHLYPEGFSFHITITLAALTNDYVTVFTPIPYAKRIGQSKLSWGLAGFGNFLRFCRIILRITAYFSPLRVLLRPSPATLSSDEQTLDLP